MRNLLNRLHQVAAIIAGGLLVLIVVLTLIQVGARLAGLPAHSWDEVATLCMAGSTFIGLAYAWRAGAHIRMDLIVTRLHGAARRVVEILALLQMLAVISYLAWYMIDMTVLSWQMNDVSQGLLPIPLWIPQSALALGSVMLVLALAESLFDAFSPRTAAALATAATAEAVLARASGEA